MTAASRPVSTKLWITPQEQLNRLCRPTEKRFGNVDALRGISIRKVIIDHMLPSALTNWYSALEKLDLLSEEIPPLSGSLITKILNSPCPIKADQLKPDGTSYKVRDTHLLYLVPKGTLNALEARVSAYGQRVFEDYVHPLQFRYFHPEAREEHANTEHEAEWILISNDILEGSQRCKDQAALVKELSERSLADYQIPTLKQAAAAMFLHKVATGESLYPDGNEQNDYRCIYTHVRERYENVNLAVGGFDSSGVHIDNYHGDDFIGVAALRSFS